MSFCKEIDLTPEQQEAAVSHPLTKAFLLPVEIYTPFVTSYRIHAEVAKIAPLLEGGPLARRLEVATLMGTSLLEDLGLLTDNLSPEVHKRLVRSLICMGGAVDDEEKLKLLQEPIALRAINQYFNQEKITSEKEAKWVKEMIYSFLHTGRGLRQMTEIFFVKEINQQKASYN